MKDNILYAKIVTEVSDYRAGTKRKEEDMFGMLSKKLDESKIDIELLTFKGVLNFTSKLEGPDNLDITTILDDGSNKVMNETRALNRDYKESVGKRRIPENGVIVDAVQVEIDDKTLSIKIIKEEKSGDILAVVKELHIPISKEEYQEKKIGTN